MNELNTVNTFKSNKTREYGAAGDGREFLFKTVC